MSSVADARFLFARALGLVRRGWTSLHTRGWRASWHACARSSARDRGRRATPLWLPPATAVRAVRGARRPRRRAPAS